MAKGHYTGKHGGSRSGYYKGVKDTLKVIAITALIALAVYSIFKYLI